MKVRFAPLHLAVFANKPAAVEYLLKRGADKDLEDSFGHKASYYVSDETERGYIDNFEFDQEIAVDPNSSEGRTLSLHNSLQQRFYGGNISSVNAEPNEENLVLNVVQVGNENQEAFVPSATLILPGQTLDSEPQNVSLAFDVNNFGFDVARERIPSTLNHAGNISLSGRESDDDLPD